LSFSPAAANFSGMRAPPIFLCALLGLLAAGTSAPARAAAVQQHGLVFEEWVRDIFFDGYRPPSATQKWDIPAAVNKRHGGVPVNPKAAKYRTPVDLGDALRQFDIAEPFILVVGFWEQDGDDKRFVNLIAPRVEPAVWRKLWGDVTRADLERLDAVIKDRSLTPEAARAAAQRMKNAPPFTRAVIVLNPKIDDATQRRLQCSLRFEDVFKFLAPDAKPDPQAKPELWGIPFPGEIASPPREIKKEPSPAVPSSAVKPFMPTGKYGEEVEGLQMTQARLAQLVMEIHRLYRDDPRFLAAFDLSQKKWEEYCAATINARFPTDIEYGSVFPIAVAAVKQPLIEARIQEISAWTNGTVEGDVSKGSVKFSEELDAIRKKLGDGTPQR
jgi:hypothetical protein